MKTRIVASALYAAMAAFAGLAWAGPYEQVPYEPQPRPEIYIFGYGGVNFVDELEANSVTGFALEVSADDGMGAGGGIGLRFPQFLGGSRLEVEGYYRSNDSGGSRPNNAAFGGAGDVVQNGVMLNFVKEFAWEGVVPYVGIGAGYGSTDLDVTFPGGRIDGEETTFNWQLIAGLEFPFWQRVSVYAEYHYMPVQDFSMNATTLGVVTPLDFDDFSNHSLFGGIRVYF